MQYQHLDEVVVHEKTVIATWWHCAFHRPCAILLTVIFLRHSICMALYSLYCAEVPLRNCSLTPIVPISAYIADPVDSLISVEMMDFVVTELNFIFRHRMTSGSDFLCHLLPLTLYRYSSVLCVELCTIFNINIKHVRQYDMPLWIIIDNSN